jgi:hypothetical protein
MTQRGGIPRENGNRMEKTYKSTDTKRTSQHKREEQGNSSRGGAMLFVAIIALLIIGAGFIFAFDTFSGDDPQSTTTPAPTTAPPTTEPPTTTPAPTTSPPTTEPPHQKVIHVYHFHGTTQCKACVDAEQYARYTLETYFPDKLDDGTITYQSLNYMDSANSEIVNELNVYGSSIYVVVDEGGEREVYNPTYNLWSLTGDKQRFVEYLTTYLEKLL